MHAQELKSSVCGRVTIGGPELELLQDGPKHARAPMHPRTHAPTYTPMHAQAHTHVHTRAFTHTRARARAHSPM